ncbi:MAG: hypothetical protein ACRD5H_19180, partial [Nitrososphaerales archaeon]
GMSKDKIFVAEVNPLVFIEADDRFQFGEKGQLTPEAVLRYLSSESQKLDMENIKQRYFVIAKQATRLFMIPAEYKILMKIVYPLRHGIGSYIIGNYLETIALCGTVAEMIALFLFEISEISVGGKPISSDEEAKSNLHEFEKMRQSRRTEKLMQFGLIEKEIEDKFVLVSGKRNGYLHSISKTYENIEADAREVFNATLEIFLNATMLGIKDGKTVLNQKILDYLEKKGFTEKE